MIQNSKNTNQTCCLFQGYMSMQNAGKKKHGQHIVFISIKTITLVKREKKPSHCNWS